MNTDSSQDQWLKNYDQQQQTSTCSDTVSLTSSSIPFHGGAGAAEAVVRRRSRASRKTIPTTLLNATPGNFRALVQQFTGRSSGANSVRRRGPLTLDFGCPSSSSEEEIFPRSGSAGFERNYGYTLYRHGDSGQRHGTWPQREEAGDVGGKGCRHKETTSYQMGQQNTLTSYGGYHDHHDRHNDISGEYTQNISYGLDRRDLHHDLHDMATLEEFMMGD